MNARNKIETRRWFARIGVFSDKTTVLAETVTTSPSGGKIKTYAPASGLTDIPSVFLSQKSRYGRNEGSNITVRSHRIKLNGNYPTIRVGMKVTCSNVEYRVDDVSFEGTGVFTTLDVSRWS